MQDYKDCGRQHRDGHRDGDHSAAPIAGERWWRCFGWRRQRIRTGPLRGRLAPGRKSLLDDTDIARQEFILGGFSHIEQIIVCGAPRGAMTTGILAAVGCAMSQFWITPKLDRLRADIAGPVEVLPLDDPRRVAFGLFHGYNVAGLGVAMLGAAVCLGFLLYAMRPRT